MSVSTIVPFTLEQTGEYSTVMNPKRVVPAIPRALERQQAHTNEKAPVLTSDSVEWIKPLDSSSGTLASDVVGDWASAVEEEQDVHDRVTTEQATESKGNDIGNGDLSPHGEIHTRAEPAEVFSLAEPSTAQHTSSPYLRTESPPPHSPPVSLPLDKPLRRPNLGRELFFGTLHKPQPTHLPSQNLVFGTQADSNESSPTLPPSAASTVNTYPTPLSETTSSPQSNPLLQTCVTHPDSFSTLAPSNWDRTSEDIDWDSDLPDLLRHSSAMDRINGFPKMQLLAMREHLLHQFNNPSYADCVLHLTVNGEEDTLMLHRVMLASSSILTRLFPDDGVRNSKGQLEAHWSTNDPYITIPILNYAITVLYSAPPVPYKKHPGHINKVSVEEISDMLSFLAAGSKLGIEILMAQRAKLAKRSVCFDYLEMYLAFALHEDILDGDDLVQGPDNATVDLERLGQDAYYPCSLALFDIASDFILNHAPQRIDLDFSAPPSASLGGLPYYHPLRLENPHQNDSAILAIQFGEMSLPPTPEVSLISTLLLSLPFHALKRLLGRLGNSGNPQLVRDVISEREKRRAEYRARAPAAVVNRAKWEENVEGEEPELGIARTFVG